MVAFTLTMRRHLIRLTSAYSAIYLLPFGKAFGSIFCMERLTTKQNAEFT